MTLYDSRHIALPESLPVHPEGPAVAIRTGVVVADDGRELEATWFSPQGPPRGGVVLVPAMAVPRTYYAELATWLAGQGQLVLTFDYRGMGSRDQMRQERGDVLRWAGDAASALEALDAEVRSRVAGGAPLTWIGHSLGGQVLPFARHDLLARAVFIASGSGYWRHNQPPLRWFAPVLWRTVAPVAMRAAGYYPGRRIRLLDDLPAGVMRQWGRWCLRPDYYLTDVPHMRARLDEVTLPILSVSFTDDELLGASSMAELDSWYAAAQVRAERYAPAELGATRIGHHGFFRPRHRAAWEQVLGPVLAPSGEG